MNKRRILSALMDHQPNEAVLASLSSPVRSKFEALVDALNSKMTHVNCLILACLLQEHDLFDRQIWTID